jgi:hypothetical protein
MMGTKAKDVTSNNKLKQTHLEQFFNQQIIHNKI